MPSLPTQTVPWQDACSFFIGFPFVNPQPVLANPLQSQDNHPMATQPIADRLISVEEYLSTIYHPDCEYNNGVVQERNLGEFEHSFLQAVLVTLFTTHIEEWGVFGLPEQRVQINPKHYLIPDIAVLKMGTPRERILTRPPLITIEIMSPEDRFRDVADKTHEYRVFGVPNIWVLDPNAHVAYRATDNGLELVPSGKLIVEGTSILVDTKELFDRLDRF
jgi:Uma2 family endonuclease